MLHQITLVYPDVFFAPITIHAATFEKFRRIIHYLWNCYFKLRLRKHRRILESNSLCQLTNYRSWDSCDKCNVRDADREIPFSSHYLRGSVSDTDFYSPNELARTMKVSLLNVVDSSM